MPNLDLNILNIMGGDTPVLKVMQGDNEVWAAPTLPYDAVVEWLQCDTNAYIDTGIRTCDIGKISSMMQYDSKPSGNIGDGSVVSSSFFGMMGMVVKSNTYYYGAQFAGSAKEVTSSTTWGDGQFHTLLLDTLNGTFTLDNNTPISLEIASTPPELNWHLFKRNAVARTVVSKRKVIKIWNKSNVLVRDYIPVRVGQVGYMYDKVTKQLFGNANSSGAFTFGNDV